MELVTSSWEHCCSPRMVVVVVVVVVVTMHSALSSPHLAAVGAAAGGVLAVDGPAILVTALQPVVDNLRHAVLRIREGPVAAPESSRTLNTATRIGLHIPYFLILLYSPILLGVCQGQLGDVLQVVRVEGEAGDAERGGGQLEIDDGLAVLRRTQVNTEYSEHYTSLTLTA